MPLDPQLIFKLLVFIAGSIGLGWGSMQIEADWVLRFMGLLAASFIFALALNLINLKGMIHLVLNKSEL